jgi:hypothetical protein
VAVRQPADVEVPIILNTPFTDQLNIQFTAGTAAEQLSTYFIAAWLACRQSCERQSVSTSATLPQDFTHWNYADRPTAERYAKL